MKQSSVYSGLACAVLLQAVKDLRTLYINYHFQKSGSKIGRRYYNHAKELEEWFRGDVGQMYIDLSGINYSAEDLIYLAKHLARTGHRVGVYDVTGGYKFL